MSDAPETKTCANETCGKPFSRRTSSRESKPAFAARPYCSRACKIEASRVSAGTKTCKNPACGKPYEKRPRESRNEFQGRSYCSIECRHQAPSSGRRRALPRRGDQILDVVRAPGQPWRPAGWTREPNVYAGVRQAC